MAAVEDIVTAAIAWAKSLDREVEALSLDEIATAAGISRSTLLRRVGGRDAIDTELARRGRPRKSLPERVLDTTASLIATHGLADVTLERIADAAGCTVASIYGHFDGRDALLIEAFDRHAVLPQLTPLLESVGDDLEILCRKVYRQLIDTGLDRSSVTTTCMIEVLSRPDSALAEHIRLTYLPRSRKVMGEFFTALIDGGRLREQPVETLLAQFFGPCQIYIEIATVDRRPRPPAEREAAAVDFASNFVRAVTHHNESRK